MTQIEIRLFGRFQTKHNDDIITRYRSNKVKALLAFLASEYAETHSREKVMTLLWPDIAQKSAQLNLRQTLHRTRGLFPNLVEADKKTVRLNPELLGENGGLSADTITFDRLLKTNEKHKHHAIQTCNECLGRLEEVAELYNGTFLADFYLPDSTPFESWSSARREQYQRRAFDALSTLTKAYLRQGNYVSAEKLADHQLSLDPLRESAHRHLMEALAQNGQRDQALAHFEQCRQLLLDELGMQPARRTLRLAEQIAADEIDFSQPQTPEIRGYELLEKLGEGAYGVVHRAYQPLVNREVAVKIIQPRYANRPKFIRRFEAEAQTVARLEHPFILPLYDFWREADGAFLVMRYMRGGNLAEALATGERWPIPKTLQLLDQIGDALAAAHQQGVIHRDLKPANILRDEVGNNYLADFGIARHILDAPKTSAQLTTSPYYTSPEQLQGAKTTPESDIYTLGFLLFELLTGQKPFPAASVGTLIQHHLQTPLPLASALNSQLPEAIDAVLATATAKDPSDRYPTVPTLVAAVREALADVAVTRESQPLRPKTIININPYKGLRAFQEEDAGLFFGRKQLIDKLIAQLENRFLAVVGPSGSGKSSVVKAGLLPAVRDGALAGSDQWFITEMVPGSHPLEELEAALLRVAIDPPNNLIDTLQKDERGLTRTLKRIMPPAAHNDGVAGQLLLVIDQFEELFTLVDGAAQRQHFVDLLIAALDEPHSQLRLVVTLRADFYDQPLQIRQLANLMEANTVIVTPLDSAELEQAITHPAALAGVRFEDGLVPTIIDDIRDQPGMLPLLQYALTELFERRENNLLTRSAYAKLGGVQGVLGQRAEEIFESFSTENQSLTRQLFLRLVTLGEGVEDTRRRVLLSELENLRLSIYDLRDESEPVENDFSEIVSQFGNVRLLSFDRDPATRTPTVEVAHEALLREWQRLRTWLSESREDLRLQRRVGVISAEWQQSNQDPSFLLRGGQLQQFEEWAAQTTIALTENEQHFVESSIQSRNTQAAAEEARRQRELEQTRQLAASEKARATEQEQSANRLRQRAWLLSGALAIAAILAVAAIIFGNRATASANLAATREVEAENNAALAQESAAIAVTREAQAARQQAIAEEQARLSLARELSSNVLTNLTEDSELSLLLAMKSLEITHTYEGEAALHRALQTHRLRSTTELNFGAPFTELTSNAWQIFVRPYEKDFGDPIAVWNAENGTKLYEVPFFTYLEGIDRNRTMFAASLCIHMGDRVNDCDWLVYDTETGAEVEHPITREGMIIDRKEVVTVLIHPDWEHFVWGYNDGRIDVQNMVDDSVVTLTDHQGAITGIGFSETNALMVSADTSGKLILWDLANTSETGEVPIVTEWQTSESNPDSVLNSAKTIYERDGQTFIVTTPNNETSVAVWVLDDENVRQLSQQENRDTNTITDFTVNQSGTIIASASHDGVVRVSEIQDGTTLFDLTGNRVSISQIDFLNDDAELLGVSQDSQILVWDASQIQSEVRAFGQVSSLLGAVTVDGDGKLGAASDVFGSTILYDLENGQELVRLDGTSDGARVASFHPNGDLIASGGYDGKVRIHDVNSGEVISEWQAHAAGPEGAFDFWAGLWGVAYSPDGTLLASSSEDGTGKLWDADTGELIKQFDFANLQVSNTAFSPDGQLLAFHAGEGGIGVYDVESLEQLWLFDGLIFGPGLAFSSDSKKLAATSDLGLVGVWDMATGQPSFEMPTLNGFVTDVAFSRDGQFMITSDAGGTVIWDANTGRELFELADSGALNEFVTTPNGTLFGGDFYSGTVAEFTLYLDDAFTLAQERLTREMTEQECNQYLRNPDCALSFIDEE